jgi:NAD(P)-dependent dehydrogenase (short-subunit alcohol dehydrogenase family)
MALVSRLLPGKVVAVTGCSTGIGRAVAIGVSLFPARMDLWLSVC